MAMHQTHMQEPRRSRNPHSHVELEEPSTHVVSIDKSGRNKHIPVGLGLNFGDGTYLRIVTVYDDGLIMAWNLSNPAQLIRSGDRIVEVNGFGGDANAMVRKCNEAEHLSLVVRRTADFEQRHALLQRRNLTAEDYELLSILDMLSSAAHLSAKDFVVHPVFPLKMAKTVPSSSMCVVCLTDHAPEMDVAVLPCQHAFCPGCIGQWVSNHRPQCPICKRSIYQPKSSDEGDDSIHDISWESEDPACESLKLNALVHPSLSGSYRALPALH